MNLSQIKRGGMLKKFYSGNIIRYSLPGVNTYSQIDFLQQTMPMKKSKQPLCKIFEVYLFAIDSLHH